MFGRGARFDRAEKGERKQWVNNGKSDVRRRVPRSPLLPNGAPGNSLEQKLEKINGGKRGRKQVNVVRKRGCPNGGGGNKKVILRSKDND